jgi:hypothetical protein
LASEVEVAFWIFAELFLVLLLRFLVPSFNDLFFPYCTTLYTPGI